MNVHEIEFRRKLGLVAEVPRKRRLELLRVTAGSRFRVRLVPYHKGLREVADLYFEGGLVVREVSFDFFFFVEHGDPAS